MGGSESLLGFFQKLFSTDFMPHGHCFGWRPEIVWLHVISDSIITLCYYSIPLMLVYFVRRKRDIPFNWIFLMFGAFIFCCGTTHALNVYTLWNPVYRLDGVAKAVTAGVSLLTTLMLIPLVPQALSLRSPKELEAAIKEKEVLLREIHHRVKNNFQITMSFLSLQARTLSDTRSRELFLENENRIKSMALVHERLYSADSLSQIQMKDYLDKLVPNILSSYGGSSHHIQLSLRCDPVLLSIGQAIPLGLIINELLTNAVKHGLSVGATGEIAIELTTAAEMATLRVSDSGNRFPARLDFKSAETLGLQLVTAFTRQLDGTLELRQEGKTEFVVRFKVS